MPRLVAPPKPQLGRRPLFFHYHPNFIAKVKQVPGCSWDPERKCWHVPDELANALLAEAARMHLGPSLGAGMGASFGRKIESYEYRGAKLFPHQIESVNRALGMPGGRYLFGHEMGVGKSAPAVAALVLAQVARPLIVTLASIKSTWAEDHVPVWSGFVPYMLNTGKEALEYEAEPGTATIISYELLQALGHPEQFDAVIFDEVHCLKNPKAIRNRYAAALLEAAKPSLVLGLSGTLVPNRFIDIHGILDLLWPGRFGSAYKFKARYGIPEESEYSTSGQVFRHLNSQFEEELAQRLAAVSHRVTLAEVAIDLPPFYVTVDQRRPSAHLKKAATQFAKLRDRSKMEGLLTEAFAAKGEWTLEIVDEHQAEARQIAIITHLKSSAKQLFALCQKAFPDFAAYHIDGDVAATKRKAIVDLASEQERAIVVATMESIGTGLNAFADFDLAVFAELNHKPEKVLQALGRFNRLNSKRASKCIILSFLSTPDERVALNVLDKIKEANRLSRAGAGESALEKSLAGDDVSDDDFFAGLCDAILAS